MKVRSRPRMHNINRNYNLMGFDTIEINLVMVFIDVETINAIIVVITAINVHNVCNRHIGYNISMNYFIEYNGSYCFQR